MVKKAAEEQLIEKVKEKEKESQMEAKGMRKTEIKAPDGVTTIKTFIPRAADEKWKSRFRDGPAKPG